MCESTDCIIDKSTMPASLTYQAFHLFCSACAAFKRFHLKKNPFLAISIFLASRLPVKNVNTLVYYFVQI